MAFTQEQEIMIAAEMRHLKHADNCALHSLCQDSTSRRITWFHKNKNRFVFAGEDLLAEGYKLLLARLHITPTEAPIIRKSKRVLLFHSVNFCPTLEACKRLNLDTRYICKRINEASTDQLLKQLHPQLSFKRNYEKLRPYTAYCEEMIIVDPLKD